MKKKININESALKSYMSENNLTYKDLALMTGLNASQAFKATKGQCGLTTLAHLLVLGIDNLFFYSETEPRKKKSSVQKKVQIKIIE